jgi:Cd2+/Zn2+-exporting ATPase
VATQKLESRTTPVDCADCARKAEKQIQQIEGVTEASFDFINRRLRLSFDDTVVDRRKLRQMIDRQGHFKLVDHGAGHRHDLPVSRRLLTGILISLVLVIAGLICEYFKAPTWVINVLFYAAILVGGWDIYLKGIAGVRAFQIDMNVLMSLAVIGAVAIGDFHEAAAVILLFGLAELLESYSLWRLSRNLTDMQSFTSGHALLKDGEQITHVAPEELLPDNLVVIREGMRIPADGVVTTGTSYVDNSALTGESIPDSVGPGSKVFAGAVNREGYLEVKVTAIAEESEIGKILKLVGEASASRSNIERVVDKFARIYTPVVVSLAILLAIVPPLLPGQTFADWFYKALIFLVISCPCALVISTPVAVTTALASASRLKAIFRKGEAVERLAAVMQIAFDKTGTLTLGTLKLERVTPMDSTPPNKILQIAYSLEQASNHPYARAIRRYAQEKSISPLAVDKLAAISGIGVQGEIEGKSYRVGGPQVLPTGASQEPDDTHAVYLTENGSVVGAFRFSEEIRPEAVETIAGLRRQGYDPIGMLSGDRQQQADKVASDLKLDYARGALTPEQKYDILKGMKEPTVMIGDGINDAVALSGAFVSISIARFGVDLTSQQADVTLFGDTISALPKLMRLTRQAVSTIRVNIAFAFFIKLLFLTLAVVGYANIWMAVVADMGASLAVIANSLRLMRVR